MKALCVYCTHRVWDLKIQDIMCMRCKLLVQNKCCKSVDEPHVSKYRESSARTECDIKREVINTSDNKFVSVIKKRDLSEPLPDLTVKSVPVEDKNKPLVDLEPASPRQYCFNEFELNRLIGQGSYGKVFMVKHKKTRQIYAMKVIEKAAVRHIEYIRTEKRIFETLSNYPFLVGLHSSFQTQSKLCFVTELVRGGDFFHLLQKQNTFPEDHSRFYTAEIALALNFLHFNGIIYRDLKLENVLLDHEGHIKLTDYGLCKQGVRSGHKTSSFVGTRNYMAPEMLLGLNYDFSVDWWALGVLLYEMLTGRSPYSVPGASANPYQNNNICLSQIILKETISIPKLLSVKAGNVLKGFLSTNPAYRLGCHNRDSFNDITDHAFFEDIDWSMLEQKQVPPPYKPKLDSDSDVANFPHEFTDQPVYLTPDDPSIIEKIDQTDFEGFEYENPLLLGNSV